MSNSEKVAVTTESNIEILFQRALDPLYAERPNRNGQLVSLHLARYGQSESWRPRSSKYAHIIEVPFNYIKNSYNIKGAFSLFNRQHRIVAGKLIDDLTKTSDVENFFLQATNLRAETNPYLYQYALNVAVRNHEALRINPPSLFIQMPSLFVDASVIAGAQAERNLRKKDTNVYYAIPKSGTATLAEVEHRLAYFREDIAGECLILHSIRIVTI